MITLQLLQRRRKTERWRENYRYKQWYNYRHQKGTPQVHAERQRWWVLYSNARIKRIKLDREIKEHTPKFVPGVEVDTKGVDFIKNFEGYVGHVYDDGTGVMTVGYGHIENVPGNGIWIPGQRTRFKLTEAEATELLHKDLNKNYAPTIRKLGLKFDQSQFNGLVSFVYNCGVGAVGPSTTVGKLLRAKQIHAAANALLAWDKAGGSVLQGLVRRREAEHDLLLN